MKRMQFLGLLSAFVMLAGCSKDEAQSGILLRMQAVNSDTGNTAKVMIGDNVELTDFRISIRDVVFKNESNPDSSLNTDEIQLRGPYQIDLLDGGDALTQTIGTAYVPDGFYKELRFKFHKDEDLPATDALFDKSIYIEGTIDGKPFVFWHDTSENLDVGRTTGVEVAGGVVNYTVTFDISQFLSSLNQIDLGTAADGNGDGLIEIYPNDEDGNQDLAYELKENIKATADAIDR